MGKLLDVGLALPSVTILPSSLLLKGSVPLSLSNELTSTSSVFVGLSQLVSPVVLL